MYEERIAKRKERDKEIYLWYVDFIYSNGRSPNMSEAGRHLSITRERVRKIFNRLAEEGYLIRINKHNNKGNCFSLGIKGIIELKNGN